MPTSRTGYSNSQIDALIERLEGELVGYGRAALLEEIWRILVEDIAYVPLHQQMLVWAMREEFDIPLRLIDGMRFDMARLERPGG